MSENYKFFQNKKCEYFPCHKGIPEDEVSLSHYAYGFVTLGTGMDELSALYLNHEQIQEAYIVDCISLVLLSKAYEAFAQNYLFWEIPIRLIFFHRSMIDLRRMRSGLRKV